MELTADTLAFAAYLAAQIAAVVTTRENAGDAGGAAPSLSIVEDEAQRVARA